MPSPTPPTPCRLAIFDFDGTLADSLPWFLANVNQAADRYGFRPIGPADAERLRGLGAREVVRHVGLPLWKLPLVARYMRRAMAEAEIAVFDGVAEVLERAAEAGVRLALVTSNAEANARRVLGPRHAARFQHLHCGVPMFGKQRALRRVLRASRVAPEAALYVGDEIRDAQAARAAGVPFGAVGWGYTHAEALAACRPRVVFHDVAQLAGWLCGPAPSVGAGPGGAQGAQ